MIGSIVMTKVMSMECDFSFAILNLLIISTAVRVTFLPGPTQKSMELVRQSRLCYFCLKHITCHC